MPDSRHGKLHLRKFKRLFKCSEMVGVPVLPVFTQNAVLHQNSWTQVVLWISPQNICESLKACLSSRPTDLSVSVPLFHNSGSSASKMGKKSYSKRRGCTHTSHPAWPYPGKHVGPYKTSLCLSYSTQMQKVSKSSLQQKGLAQWYWRLQYMIVRYCKLYICPYMFAYL